MKNWKDIYILIDQTFGFGPRFRVTHALLNDKTIKVGPRGTATMAQRISGQTFCEMDDESIALMQEAERINSDMEKIRERSRKLRDKIREARERQLRTVDSASDGARGASDSEPKTAQREGKPE